MQSDRSASADGHPVAPSNGLDPHRELAEVVMALDTRAPGAARAFVAERLER